MPETAAIRTSAPSPTDAELLRATRAGDPGAMHVLLDRYRPFVRAKARTYFLAGGDRDDVVQEGMVGLYKAIRDFDPDQGSTFRGFAELCVVRQIITAIKAATRHKHGPLNAYVSLHAPVVDGGTETELGERLPDRRADPADAVVQQAEVEELQATIRRLLSALEVDVLRRYLDGQSYAEIADSLQRQVKSIDNAIQRIKRKLDGRLHIAAGRG